MKVDTSRKYYFPIYLACIIYLIIFPNIISLFLLIFVVLIIEIYRATHCMKIGKDKEIYIFEGIINRKITKIKRDLITSVTLEKNPYLQIFNLSTIRIKTFDKEYKIVGIKNGEKIFKLLSKNES